MTRTGKPGRMVMVGWTLSERPTMRWPIWLTLSAPPRRIARISSSSLPLLPTSDPMLSSVERMAALNNVPQWLSTSSSRPA